MNKTFLSVCIVLALSVCACDLIDYEPKPGPSYERSARRAIKSQLETFVASETQKDDDAHRPLFLSALSPINFVLKNYGNPFIFSLTRDSWIGFFMSWDYEYYPVYSAQEFYIEKGVAIEKNHFQGFKNDVEDIYGTDHFMFVETPDDWKILDLSSVIINPDDTVDYGNLDMITTSPDSIVSVFQEALTNRSAEDFTSSFINPNAPCLSIQEKFFDEFDADTHGATAFISSLNNQVFDFGEINVVLHDDLLAVASFTYTETINGELVDHGKVLASLAAAPGQEWKINALVFSSYAY